MVKDQKFLEVLSGPVSKLINDLHLAGMKTEPGLGACDRLVRILLQLLILCLFKLHQIWDFVRLLAAFRESARTLENYPVALVVDVAVKLRDSLELGDNDPVDSHYIPDVYHVRQHSSVIWKELNWHESLGFSVRLSKSGIVFAIAVQDCSSLLVKCLINDSDLASGLLLNVRYACIEHDAIDVIRLSWAKRDRV